MIYLYKSFCGRYSFNTKQYSSTVVIKSLVFTSKYLVLVEFWSIRNSYKLHHVIGAHVEKRSLFARDEWIPKTHPRDAGNLLNVDERVSCSCVENKQSTKVSNMNNYTKPQSEKGPFLWTTKLRPSSFYVFLCTVLNVIFCIRNYSDNFL